jgi:cyclase
MRFIVIALSSLAFTSAWSQETATAYTSAEVAPGIYMVTGADGFGGGNIGLLAGEDHVAMIDDGLAPTAEILFRFVNERAGRPVDFLVNTHVHGDHAGGNAWFADHDTVIFAHDNIRRRLESDAEPAGGAAGLPVITFDDGMTFYLNGIRAEVHHVPAAHTDGDAFVVFPQANVIQTGDVFFNSLFPFIDLDSGGSVDGYVAAQRQVLELADETTRIIPGHGDLGNKADLERDAAMLIDARARVKALMDKGMDEDAVLAANPLADYDSQYSWAFISTERMTRTLYRDLAGN